MQSAISQKSILLIDSISARIRVKQVCGNMGLTNIHEAQNSEDAWNLIQEGLVPDLILSESQFTTMPGLELLKKIRSNPKTSCVPFVFITAESDNQSVLKAVQADASDYILKPFSETTIEEKIKKIFKIDKTFL